MSKLYFRHVTLSPTNSIDRSTKDTWALFCRTHEIQPQDSRANNAVSHDHLTRFRPFTQTPGSKYLVSSELGKTYYVPPLVDCTWLGIFAVRRMRENLNRTTLRRDD